MFKYGLSFFIYFMLYQMVFLGNKEAENAMVLGYWILIALVGTTAVAMLVTLPKVTELKKPMGPVTAWTWFDRFTSVVAACAFAYLGHTWLAVAETMLLLVSVKLREAYRVRFNELNSAKE